MYRFGHIYVARFGDRIKIGYSEFAADRVRRLGLRLRVAPELLAIFPSESLLPYRTERECQARFAHLCVGGEWFRDAPEIVEWAYEKACEFPDRNCGKTT